MGEKTGIKWTDSTHNPWHGCTKVGPACDHCYAEGVDKRGGGGHWGHGAERRLLSEHARNEPYRWQKQADKFEAEHGRRRRVFTLSMGDLFDNEVPIEWREDHMDKMTMCDRLEWQICTKRISNLPKMVLSSWTPTVEHGPRWPRHIGVLVTIVTQAEADRDVPRLLELKKRFGIPWVGISYEPAQEEVRFWNLPTTKGLRDAMGWDDDAAFCDAVNYRYGGFGLDWIIFGGKSGPQWNDRPFAIEWAYATKRDCEHGGVPFFMKQVAAFRPTDDMIPADLMIRQWPKGH